MIEVTNLTKRYVSKKKGKCLALNNISFNLPDTGLIFITGKSGSGKSTLLNLIAGFDDVTSGKILIDGNDISNINKKQLSKYHSSYLGFIFQDYNLLEELTVYQNIALALDFTQKKDDALIKETLKVVDLEGFETRYPKELSGGQCQRVAIARAIVKGPRMILGDEPTGNLDGVTTPQILKLLKRVSKTRLVIIVSHNLADADLYADRIIELSEGQIISDRSRVENYENEFKIEDDSLFLPHHKNLNNLNINEIYEHSSNIEKIVQINSGFIKTDDKFNHKEKVEFEGKKISFKNTSKLFWLFFKRDKLSKLITIFLSAIIISVFYVLQAFGDFDGNKALAIEVMNQKEEALVLQKTRGDNLYNSILSFVTTDELEGFSDNYNGEIFSLYNHSLPISSILTAAETQANIDTIINSFYAKETLGVLTCNEEFLIKLFGVDGEIRLLAGSATSPSYGMIITDYIADSLMYFYPDEYHSYEDLLGDYIYNTYKYGYISGVIETGYEKEYEEVYNIFQEYKSVGVNYPLEDKLSSCAQYPDFVDDVSKYLAVSYNLSQNYLEEIQKHDTYSKYAICKYYVDDENGTNYYSSSTTVVLPDSSINVELNDDEIIVGSTLYNKIYKTSYNKNNLNEFVPHKITITKYDTYDCDKVLYSRTFTIKKIVYSSVGYYLNQQNFKDMMAYDILPYKLYFSDITQTERIMNFSENYNYTVANNDKSGISLVNRSLAIFGDFVSILEYIMLIVCVCYLTSFGFKSIRRNYYEIGVLKTLGGRDRDLGRIFIFETLFVGVGVILLSIVGIYIASNVANQILIESFKIMFNAKFYKLKIITIYPSVVVFDLIITMMIIFISSLIPTLAIKRFKYIDILKAKE